MLVIRSEQLTQLTASRQADIRSRLAQVIADAEEDCTPADAVDMAEATQQAGAGFGLVEFEELERLYRLFHAQPLDERDTEALQRILQDTSVSDSRQRLARAEDALAHRRRMAQAQANFVDALRGGARRG